jgi:hypothetical protein
MKIEKTGTRDKCIHNVAVTAHDAGVCANLKNAGEKKPCADYSKLSEFQP